MVIIIMLKFTKYFNFISFPSSQYGINIVIMYACIESEKNQFSDIFKLVTNMLTCI